MGTAEQTTDVVVSIVWRLVFVLLDPHCRFTVGAVPGPDSTTIVVRVAQKDLGKVIGKRGAIVHSLRVIVGAIGMAAKHSYSLDVDTHPI